MNAYRIFAVLALCMLLDTSPAQGQAGEKPKERKFATPPEAVAAAEEAFGKRQYDVYVDCFSPAGQKDVAKFYVTMWAQILGAPQPPAAGGAGADEAPNPEQVKALLKKHGVTDIAKKEGETDEQLAERLLSQVKDKRAFVIDGSSLMFPASAKAPPPVKGEVQELKTTGAKATGKYAVKQGGGEMKQDIAFESADGSWKIAKFVFFVSPEGG